MFSSKTLKTTRYCVVLLQKGVRYLSEILFISICKNRNIFTPRKTYCVENVYRPILEILSYIFAETEIHLNIYQNLTKTPYKEQITIMRDQFHNGKKHLHHGINETIRRIKVQYTWPGLTKDVDNSIKNCQTCQQTKICRNTWTISPCQNGDRENSFRKTQH